MPELQSQDIDFIKNEIKKRGLKANLFIDELLDHICCHIESSMSEGTDFESAYQEASQIINNDELTKAKRNYFLLINYKSFLTSGLLYFCLIFFIASWLFTFWHTDWLGLTAYILTSLVILRFSIIIKSDTTLPNSAILSTLLKIVFTLFFFGAIFRFLWLNFGISYKHSTAIQIISWFLLAISCNIYLKSFRTTKKIRFRKGIPAIHLGLSLLSLATFFIVPLRILIPKLAGLTIILNIIFFSFLLFSKSKGKALINSLLLTSSIIVFMYFPIKSFINPSNYEVKFKIASQNSNNPDKLFLYLNYYKFGKERLTLIKKSDSIYLSKPIIITGGNINIAYKISVDSTDKHRVILNSEIETNYLQMKKNDTIFYIKYNTNNK